MEFYCFVQAVGDRIARALRARGDDDDIDDPDGALDADSDQCRASAPAAPTETLEVPPVEPAAVSEEPAGTVADVALPAPANDVPQDGAPANEVPQDGAPMETEDHEKAKAVVQDRPVSKEDLEAQLRIAELKLEAKRLQLGCASQSSRLID